MTSYQVDIQKHPAVQSAALPFLRRDARAILKQLGWLKAALSILLTDDAGIRVIHRDYLNDDTPTDVISFSHLEGDGPLPTWGKIPFLGDLVISVETASREARRRRHSVRYEIGFYICHGLLHFEGFEDHSPSLRRRMFRIQESVLASAGILKH